MTQEGTAAAVGQKAGMECHGSQESRLLLGVVSCVTCGERKH